MFYVLFVCSMYCFYCSMYCLCVNVYCHRVTTQLQLTNISYRMVSYFLHTNLATPVPMREIFHFTQQQNKSPLGACDHPLLINIYTTSKIQQRSL